MPADALVHVLKEFLSGEPDWENVREPLGHLLDVLLEHGVHKDWAQYAALELSNL